MPNTVLGDASRLIPDPLCSIARHNDVDQVAMDLGSARNVIYLVAIGQIAHAV